MKPIRICVSIILVILSSVPVMMANPLSYIYTINDRIVQDVESLSIEAGVIPQYAEYPISGYELLAQLERIDNSALKVTSRRLQERLIQRLHEQLSPNPARGTVTLNGELYVNTDETAESGDWMYGYHDRQPLLHLKAEGLFAERVYGTISYSLARRESRMDFTGIATNSPYPWGNTSETNVQNSYPHSAFFGISGNNFTLLFGRDTISFGRGNTGNLIVGAHSPFHDFLKISVRNKKLRYTFITIPMSEIMQDGTTHESESSTVIEEDGKSYYPYTLFFNSLQRLFISHRLSYDFTPKFRVTLGEGTMIYSNKIDLRMFNPLMFLHNYQNYYEVNNSMHLELEYAPIANFSMYAQLFLDQYQTSGEQGSSDLPPNAYAALAGMDFVKTVSGGRISGYLEGVYTSPFAYLRAGDNTWIYDGFDEDDHISQQKQFNLDFVHAASMRDGRTGITWLGYRYGPDSIVGSLNVAYDHDNGFGISMSTFFIVQGAKGLKIEGKEQYVDLVPAEDINMTSPSGSAVEYTFVPTVGGYITLPKIDLKAYTSVSYVNRWDNSGYRPDIQIVLGARYTLSF